MLLPPPKDCCPVCAVKHGPHEAHNAQSLYYQYRFYGIHGRWPTWADAIAHIKTEHQEFWTKSLKEKNAWSLPPDGSVPIAEPLEESFHRPIGDINSTELKDVLAQ